MPRIAGFCPSVPAFIVSRQTVPNETCRWRFAYQLLCACNLAYGVTETAAKPRPFAIVPPVLPTARVIATMQVQSRLLAGSLATCQTDGTGIDGLLYGETADAAILAFRGTLPMRLVGEPGRARQTVTDWINNAKVVLTDGGPFGLPGSVHAGFAQSLSQLWEAAGGIRSLFPRIHEAAARGKRLFVTGHSKGGALACLAAARLAGTGVLDLIPAGVCTFAAPRSGNRQFAEAFALAFPDHAWRFELHDDIVPLLPPSEGFWSSLRGALATIVKPSVGTSDAPTLASLLGGLGNPSLLGGYESAGRLQFIDGNGGLIEDDRPELQAERSRLLARALAFALPDIGKAHLPMSGYGYMNFLRQRLTPNDRLAFDALAAAGSDGSLSTVQE